MTLLAGAPAGAMPVREVTAAPAPTVPSTDGRPREALLSIPALGLSGLRVVPYAGTPDDGPGTAIQDRGSAAARTAAVAWSAPAVIGNYLVTGHRSSSTAPFRYLPSLRVGARVVVVTDTHRLVYEVVRTQRTSFRSERVAARAVGRRTRPPRPGTDPRDDHAVDLRDVRGPRGRQLLVRRVPQPRAPDREDRRAALGAAGSEAQSGSTNSTDARIAGELVAHLLRRVAHLVGDDDVRQPLDVDDIDVQIAPDADAAVGVGAEQLGGRVRTPAARRPASAR